MRCPLRLFDADSSDEANDFYIMSLLCRWLISIGLWLLILVVVTWSCCIVDNFWYVLDTFCFLG